MFLSLLLLVGSFFVPTSALAESNRYLSCKDFEWLSKGVKDNDNISEGVRAEIMIELIQATDPKCFEE
jgi:hypothetical protein